MPKHVHQTMTRNASGRRLMLQHAAVMTLGASGLLELAACDSNLAKPSFKNTDITGADFATAFALTDHNGRAVTLATFAGKVVTIFFGFTQCPDVCPTTMAEMAEVMKGLGDKAKEVQVLFVTIDPERDTAAVLKQYVPAFHPGFLGLYGDAAATAATAKNFKVFYQKVPGKSEGAYTMDHTAGSYIFDKSGKVRLFLKHGAGAEPTLHDLKLLLS
jgi:protein SCO1